MINSSSLALNENPGLTRLLLQACLSNLWTLRVQQLSHVFFIYILEIMFSNRIPSGTMEICSGEEGIDAPHHRL